MAKRVLTFTLIFCSSILSITVKASDSLDPVNALVNKYQAPIIGDATYDAFESRLVEIMRPHLRELVQATLRAEELGSVDFIFSEVDLSVTGDKARHERITHGRSNTLGKQLWNLRTEVERLAKVSGDSKYRDLADRIELHRLAISLAFHKDRIMDIFGSHLDSITMETFQAFDKLFESNPYGKTFHYSSLSDIAAFMIGKEHESLRDVSPRAITSGNMAEIEDPAVTIGKVRKLIKEVIRFGRETRIAR